MLLRIVAGALVAGVTVSSALAGSTMNPQEARHFVAGKLFAFTCFDGTRGAGRIMHDGSVSGSVQIGGSGPVRHARLPVNTIQVRSNAVCASLKGLPFDPCFNLEKTDEASFRGSVSGMSFAYCSFRRHGNSIIEARAHSPRSLRATSLSRRADAAREDAARADEPARSEGPRAEAARTESPKAESPRSEPAKSEPAKPASLELRSSQQ